jgi:hypothetical protein
MPCSDVDANRQFLLAHVEQVIYNRCEVTIVGSSPVRTESGETNLPFRIGGKIDIAATPLRRDEVAGLDDKMLHAHSIRARIPFGIPLMVRPGNFLLATRLDGRKSAFTCYAASQTEDIEAIFDQNLPMPTPLAPLTIENPAFSYRAAVKVEGRTVKMHREFISRVAGQVCPPELEGQIARDMNVLSTNVNSTYRFERSGPPPAATPQAAAQTRPSSNPRPPQSGAVPQILERARAVASDKQLRLDFVYTLNPDCTSIGFATIRIIEQPKHGKITVENGTGFTSFAKDNLRYECNKSRSDGVVIVYEPESEFKGTDSVFIDAIFASGTSQKRHYTIEVK